MCGITLLIVFNHFSAESVKSREERDGTRLCHALCDRHGLYIALSQELPDQDYRRR